MSVKSDARFSTRNILDQDLTKPSEHLAADVTTLATFAEGAYSRVGIKPEIIWSNLEDVVTGIPTILNRNTNASTPSVFKRAAALTIAFIMCSPLDQPFPQDKFPIKLGKIINHQNAIVVFEYCRQCLHKSTYIMTEGLDRGRVVVLKNKIKASHHFYYDTIHAIANIKDDTSFHFISLLYETLAYKANKRASYPEIL